MNKILSREFKFVGFFALTAVLLVSAVFAIAPAGIADGQKVNAPRIKTEEGTSTNWSGYAVATSLTKPQTDSVSDVKGAWTVPALACTSANTYSSAWVGIDGYSDGTVEQIGTEHDCTGGQASYYAWYEMYPKWSYKINLAVSAGDNITAEVKFVSKNKFQLTINDLTTGKTFTTTQTSNGLRQSAEWVMEAPSSSKGVLPLSNFGNIQFTSSQATVNGHTGTISDLAWKNDPITMTNASGAAKATPSALSLDGSGFGVQLNSN